MICALRRCDTFRAFVDSAIYLETSEQQTRKVRHAPRFPAVPFCSIRSSDCERVPRMSQLPMIQFARVRSSRLLTPARLNAVAVPATQLCTPQQAKSIPHVQQSPDSVLSVPDEVRPRRRELACHWLPPCARKRMYMYHRCFRCDGRGVHPASDSDPKPATDRRLVSQNQYAIRTHCWKFLSCE